MSAQTEYENARFSEYSQEQDAADLIAAIAFIEREALMMQTLETVMQIADASIERELDALIDRIADQAARKRLYRDGAEQC